MGLIPRANTAAFLDPNLLSQRLEELYAGSKAREGQKADGAAAAAPPAGVAAGVERGAAAAAAVAEGRLAAAPAALDHLMQRAVMGGAPARQAYIGAIKKRVRHLGVVVL